MHTVSVRTLKFEYRISTSSSELAQLLEYADTRPEMEGFDLEPVALSITSQNGSHCLTLPNGKTFESTPLDVLNGVCHLSYFCAAEEEPEAPLIHGGSVCLNGQRILLVGIAGFGKTTFVMHLIANGIDVEGDEHVIVRERDLVTQPRRLRVKPKSLSLLPQLAPLITASPRVALPVEGEIVEVYSVPPSVAGRPWRITAGRADHIVFLEPNHGGRSRIAALPRDAAFSRLVDDSILPGNDYGAELARLRRPVTEAQNWLLTLGDLAEAERHIRSLPEE
ncbi:MAG: hypothetical protein R3D30_10985 [Hyphomicrobiales bacterium]